jgi:hypothetical protein
MANKKLNKTLIKKLEMLPAVTKASAQYITFAPEFKELAIQQYNEGYSGWDIFLKAGFPEAALNKEFITDTLKRWRRTIMQEGVAGLYKTNKGRPKKSKHYETMTLEEKIAYLEAENAFLTELRAGRQANDLQ